MTILNRALSAIGLMLVSEHERLTRELKAAAARDIEPVTREIEAYKEGAKALSRIIDNGTAEIRRLETLVAAQADELDDHRKSRATWIQVANDNAADAQKWRNARDKRAKNRGGGK